MPISLSDTIAKAQKISDEMEAVQTVDPLGASVPSAGESKPIDNEAPALSGSTGQQVPDAAPAEASPPPASGTPEAPPPDPFADFDELVYKDADTGEEFAVRAPKAYSGKVKDGYARRSVMDRNNRYLNQARGFLEPLITSGQWQQIQPFIERASTDAEFAQVLGEAYQRRQNGQSLSFADAVANASPAQQQEAQRAVAAGESADDQDDPYVKMIVSKMRDEFGTMLKPFQERFQQDNQRLEQTQQQQRVQAEKTAEATRTIGESINELRGMYPEVFTGNEQADRANWKKCFDYATASGAIGNDPRPNEVKLAVRLAYTQLGLGAIPSVAANTLAAPRTAESVEQSARAEAARRVAATSGGGSNVQQAAEPSLKDRMKKISSKKADGTMKKPSEIAADVIRAMDKAT
jgi:hypothetical protein